MKIFKLSLFIFLSLIIQSCIRDNVVKKKVFILDFDQTMYGGNKSYLKIMYTDAINDLKSGVVYDYTKSHNRDIDEYWITANDLYHKFYAYPNQKNINHTINELSKLQTKGLGDIIKHIKSMGHEVMIIGGDTMGCAVIPDFAKQFGIEKEHIYSGYFKNFKQDNMRKTFPSEWRYVNCKNPDVSTPKSLNKSELIKHLKEKGIIDGEVIHIGDGENDLEVWQNGQANVFIGFGVNKYRKKVEEDSEIYVKNIDQFKQEIYRILNQDIENFKLTAHVKSLLEENHPGFYDNLNPGFKKKADKCFHEHRNNIDKYIKCFDDNHLQINKYSQYNNNEHNSSNKILKDNWRYKIGKDTVYLSIPTLVTSKNTEENINKYEKILSQNKNKDIIFDVRGNGGGNDMYYQKFLSKIFGKSYYNQVMNSYYSETYIEVRNSRSNINYWKDFFKKHTINDDEMILKLEKSLQNGEKMTNIVTSYPKDNNKIKSKFHKKIYLIINKYNFSAVLDFIDELKLLHGKSLILIGEKTGKDSVYMNLREEKISDNTIIIFPTQVWRNRLRGENPYNPDIKMSDTSINKLLLNIDDFGSNINII